MQIKYILIVLALLVTPAIAQFSKSTVSSQVSSQFPDQNTGAITPATTRTFLNNLLSSYQQYAGLNNQVGVTYTVAGSDYGQLVTFNNPGAIAVTLPQAAGSFSTFNFYAETLGAGSATITPSGGSTICGGATLALAQTQVVWVISDGTNYQCVFLAPGQFSNPLAVANGGTGVSSASGTALDNITGFASTGFLTRTGSNAYAFQSATNGIALTNINQIAANTTLCNGTVSSANVTACTGGTLSSNLCTPQVSNIITGTNVTFSTPTCNSVLPKYLEITLVGGGGGGAGAGASPGTATAGNISCWNTSGTACSTPVYQSGGGALGSVSLAAAAGGTVTGSGTCDIWWAGGIGQGGSNLATGGNGGVGGASTLGGQGPGGGANSGSINAGSSAVANSGSGGGGAADSTTANSGGGGGAGATCKKLITTPASSYTYTIGLAVAGGTNGGQGSAGLLQIWSRWQ